MIRSKNNLSGFMTIKLTAMAIIVSTLVLLTAGLYMSKTSAASIAFHSVRDCDSSAVIDCGALSASQVEHSYQDDQTVQKIYAAFNISATDISQLSVKTVAGRVDSKGNVYINTQSVPIASSTISASRRATSVSTKRTIQGVTYYQTSAASVVNGSYSDAFVVMKNKTFDFAIIASNGDPVMMKVVSSPPIQTKPTPSTQPVQIAKVQNQTLVNTGPTTNATVTLFGMATIVGCLLSYGYRFYRLR
jgi:hypothetical protein